MGCETCSHAYDGVGATLIAPYPDINNNRSVGNGETLKYTFTTIKKEQPNWNSPTGGVCASASFVDKVNGEFMVADHCPENLALANLATITVGSITPIVDETQKNYYGSVTILNNIANPAVLPVVKDAATGAITYVLGTDYTIDRLGIVSIAAGAIVDEADLFISYTPLGTTKIDALTTPNFDQIIIFNGINRMRKNQPVKVIVHRCQIDAVDEVEIKTTGDTGTLLLIKFTALPKDGSAVSTDISDYITIEQVT